MVKPTLYPEGCGFTVIPAISMLQLL